MTPSPSIVRGYVYPWAEVIQLWQDSDAADLSARNYSALLKRQYTTMYPKV
jgi:hypothetical protein